MNHAKKAGIGKKQLLVWAAVVLALALSVLSHGVRNSAAQVADGGGVKVGTGG